MITVKPWGSENLIFSNERYSFKEIKMSRGHKCSLQYHQKKHEAFYVLSGKIRFTFGEQLTSLQEIEMGPGDFYVIPVGLIHRMEGLEDSVYLEASTSELDDVIRLEDSYGR